MSCAFGEVGSLPCSIGFCVAITKNGSLSLWLVPPMVTLCSCIASSRAADCVLGVARLISSASTICANSGPGQAPRDLPAPSGSLVVDDIRAHDVRGHQVGSELDAVEMQIEHLAQRAHQQRLAQPRHPFQQRVAADEQARQDAVNDIGVADDDLGDFLVDVVVFLAELLDLGFEFVHGTHAMSL